MTFKKSLLLLLLLLLLLPGIQWNNMHQPVAQGGCMTFGWLCWMMLFDSILYCVGGWYFSNIIPGKIMELFLFHVFEKVIEWIYRIGFPHCMQPNQNLTFS